MLLKSEVSRGVGKCPDSNITQTDGWWRLFEVAKNPQLLLWMGDETDGEKTTVSRHSCDISSQVSCNLMKWPTQIYLSSDYWLLVFDLKPIGSMYGIYAKIDGKYYHIWHTWILWEMIGCIPVLRKSTFSGSKLFDHPPVVRRENARPSYRDATKRPDVEMGRWSNSWSVTWMTYGASLSKNLHISGANYVGSYPIGSMVLPYMLTWIPSIYPSHVSINIPAPWIRHGYWIYVLKHRSCNLPGLVDFYCSSRHGGVLSHGMTMTTGIET